MIFYYYFDTALSSPKKPFLLIHLQCSIQVDYRYLLPCFWLGLLFSSSAHNSNKLCDLCAIFLFIGCWKLSFISFCCLLLDVCCIVYSLDGTGGESCSINVAFLLCENENSLLSKIILLQMVSEGTFEFTGFIFFNLCEIFIVLYSWSYFGKYWRNSCGFIISKELLSLLPDNYYDVFCFLTMPFTPWIKKRRN